MDIGFFSELNLSKLSNIDREVNLYVNKALQSNLGVLVCAGGISNNHLVSKNFAIKLGDTLKREGILFRFIVGNKDFYYDRSEFNIDKESKFRDILREYRNIEYYLPTHNVNLKCKIRLVGLESWYDYTLYRGKGCDLKKITNKSYFGIKNRDVVYITNKSDYTLGVDDTFDVRYSNECLDLMYSRLGYFKSSFGNTYKCIAVQYFSPLKSMLGDSFFERYMGTFKGSQKYIEPLIDNGVDKCIVGCKLDNRFVKYKNVAMVGVNKNILIEHIEEENNA